MSEEIEANISLSFIKGTLVLFSVFTPENPFWIKSVQEAGASSDVSGITNNGVSDGTLYWNTKDVEPGTYYYVSENDAQISAEIEIKQNESNNNLQPRQRHPSSGDAHQRSLATARHHGDCNQRRACWQAF